MKNNCIYNREIEKVLEKYEMTTNDVIECMSEALARYRNIVYTMHVKGLDVSDFMEKFDSLEEKTNFIESMNFCDQISIEINENLDK